MRSEFLPFSKPSIDEEEIRAVAEVLRSGWITTGPNASAFETEFAGYCDAEGAVALSSATAGMHLLLVALGIGPGDEVITPSMTWVSTVNAIVRAGATPVFADIDRDTLMVTAETIAPLLTSRTRLADREEIRLVEDAAHAAGTEYRNEKIGARGTAIFSFHPIKNLTTGEGGMFCSDDPDLLEQVRRLKFHGLGVDAYDRTMQGRAPQAEVLEPGFKYNLTDIAAVLGRGQLRRLDAFIEQRARLAGRYLERLAKIDGILPLAVPSHPMRHAWHLFIVRVDAARTGMDRDTFMAELKMRNIGTGLHFRAVHTQKYYRESLNLPPDALPSTNWNSERICSLPLFPDMDETDVDSVVDAIKEVLA